MKTGLISLVSKVKGEFNSSSTTRRSLSWVFLLSLAYNWPVSCGDKQRTPSGKTPEKFIPGSFVIEMADQVDMASFKEELSSLALAEGCNLDSIESIQWSSKKPVAMQTNISVQNFSLANTKLVTLTGCDLTAIKTQQLTQAFNLSSWVNKVEPESQFSTNIRYNDPLTYWQNHHQVIKTQNACSKVKKDAKEIVVAIVDTGVNKTHPDLKGRFVTKNGQIHCANFVGAGANNPPTNKCDDDNGHGTHVAGIIAANANNSAGGMGVAACTNVRLLIVKTMNAKGKGKLSEIDRGVYWAIDQGADIVNMSIASYSEIENNEDLKSNLYEYAAAKNVLVVAASGNDGHKNGPKYSFPASNNHVVGVGAVDENNKIADYSVWGPRIQMAAPGKVLSTVPVSSGKEYNYQSGTSMAAPQISAAYALGLSAVESTYGFGKFPVDAGTRILMESVTQNSNLKGKIESGGVLDAGALVQNMVNAVAVDNKPESAPESSTPETAPSNAELKFLGLQANQSIKGKAIQPELGPLPAGAKYIGLYWGVNPTDRASASRYFELITVGSQTTAKSRAKWMFRGNSTLYAVVYNAKGKLIKKIGIPLFGS